MIRYSGTICAGRTLSVIPDYDSIQVPNRLLDGSFHIQTIGTPLRVASVRAVCGVIGLNQLRSAYANGGTITVSYEGTLYTGIMMSNAEINSISRGVHRDFRVYEINFVMAVSGEGSV